MCTPVSKTIDIVHVDKYYGNFQAIKDVSLSIREGEFFTLLGPSGCGKTTLLRMIAGFNSIEKGEIRFGESVINHVPTYRRNIGMVFQSYAIFPHLTVRQNVEYGLKPRKVPKDQMRERVDRAMKLTQIDQYANRQPQQLSGGQQQRVALSRAIVIEPDLLLMDEPLSNLDAKLRVEMRTAIREIQRELNITTIYVTHDQEEALAVSDRIAVMNMGVVEQVGKPYEIYAHPQNAFVANFIGVSNFLDGEVEPGGVRVMGRAHLDCAFTKPCSGPVRVSIRPEHIELEDPKEDAINGEIKISTFLGDFISYEVRLPNGQILQANQYVHLNPRMREIGEKVSLNVERFTVFTADGKEAIS